MLAVVETRARRSPSWDTSIPYGSHRLLVADFGQLRWAWTMDTCDRLLVAVAWRVVVVGRVVGTARYGHYVEA